MLTPRGSMLCSLAETSTLDDDEGFIIDDDEDDDDDETGFDSMNEVLLQYQNDIASSTQVFRPSSAKSIDLNSAHSASRARNLSAPAQRPQQNLQILQEFPPGRSSTEAAASAASGRSSTQAAASAASTRH